MSDPVSNHDIEDVLSSIRRLVAQGDPHQAKTAANVPTQLHPKPPVMPSKDETIEDTGPIERLVLTPAFRVRDTQDDVPVAQVVEKLEEVKSFDTAVRPPESDTIPTEDSRPLPEPAQSPTERESLEATIAQLEAAVSTRMDEWEPDGSEVANAGAFTSAFRTVTMRPREDEAFEEDGEGEVEIDAPEAAVTNIVADHIADTVAEEMHEAFPHLQAADEPPHLDADTVDEDAEEVMQTVIADDVHDDDFVETSDVETSDVEIEEPRVETLRFRHGAFQEVYDPVAEATADAAEAEPDVEDLYGDELAPDPEDAVMGSAVAEPVNAPLMDPDMMREMVGQMIREELQGEMGERITRNVRKLVRREINRVISAQEFD